MGHNSNNVPDLEIQLKRVKPVSNHLSTIIRHILGARGSESLWTISSFRFI